MNKRLTWDDYDGSREMWIALDNQEPEWPMGFQSVDTEVPSGVNYDMLLNVITAFNPPNIETVWNYLFDQNPSIEHRPGSYMNKMVQGAFSYHQDVLKAALVYREPTSDELEMLRHLVRDLEVLPLTSTAEEIQYVVYEVGKAYFANADLKNWFKLMYQVYFGKDTGPRIGTFAVMFGFEKTLAYLKSKV